MKNRFEAKEKSFYRRTPRITWPEIVNNGKVLEKKERKKTLLFNNRKIQLKFLRHTMKKDGFEIRKKRKTYVRNLCKSFVKQGLGETA